jgi:hypothetical protein
MDRTSTRRPRRLRALLVAAALGTSLFATALPAAADPSVGLAKAATHSPTFADDGIHANHWVWTRSFVNGEFAPNHWVWTRSTDELVGPAHWVWTK